MSTYSKFSRILSVIFKSVAAIIIAAIVVVLIGVIFLIRSCQAPLFNHTVEIYLRNKSSATLQVSFVVPRHEVIIDTIWERGGQEISNYVIGAYIAQKPRLQAFRFDWGSNYQGAIAIAGAADTIFRSNRRTADTAWFNPNHKRREVGIHPANPYFLALNKKVDGLQQPSDPGPPIKLDAFKDDSVRLTLRIVPNGLLLVASKSEAFHASDPSYVSMSDFALAPATVEWVTSTGSIARVALPAKARLETLVKEAPDPKSTKFYRYTHYIDYQ